MKIIRQHGGRILLWPTGSGGWWYDLYQKTPPGGEFEISGKRMYIGAGFNSAFGRVESLKLARTLLRQPVPIFT